MAFIYCRNHARTLKKNYEVNGKIRNVEKRIRFVVKINEESGTQINVDTNDVIMSVVFFINFFINTCEISFEDDNEIKKQ